MLKRLYEKSEIWFAVAWIIAYCVLASIGDNLSAHIGVSKIVTLPVLAVLSAGLYLFVKKNGLCTRYGLCKSQIPPSKLLFYIPFLILLTTNLWHGVALNASPVETLLYILSMLCVGFLEEMIFRGFLFNAMVKEGVKWAIPISAVTFGMGHIVNLINGSGAELLQNILQVIYATAIGFAFVLVYYKTKSLLSCILTHSLVNAISAFANEARLTAQSHILICAVIVIIAGGYALYLACFVNEKDRSGKESA